MTRKGRTWIITCLIVLVTGGLFYYGYRKREEWKKDHVFVELRPVQVRGGWGYDILTDGKIFIHQDIIPAIPGVHVFRTKEDALAVGQKVYERTMQGTVPMVTAAEVRQLIVIPDSTVTAH